MANAPRDENRITTLLATSNADGVTPVVLWADPVTHRLLVDLPSASGTVTSVSVTTANGISGSVANPTTTPAITLTLGNITPSTVNGLTLTAQATGFTIAGGTASKTLTVGADSSVSGTNTGDQTSVSGNAGSATILQTARTIGGVSFNGSADITVASATGGFTISGGDLALGANNITMSGSIGVTGTRITKGWFTDLEVTNAPTLGGVAIPSISSTNTLTNKRITKRTGSTTSSATPTINTDNVDMYLLTAQAVDITSFTTNLSGTPTEGQTLWIAITGTAARAITWGTSFEASTISLPTTTVSTNRLDVGFVWNTVTSKWRCVASS